MYEYDSRLAPHAYFQSVIDAMKSQGFELLTWVNMNSQQHKYHVNLFGYVRDNFLVFVVRDKSLIVELVYTEQFDSTDGSVVYHSYWSGEVVYAHNEDKMFADACHQVFAAGILRELDENVETFSVSECIDSSSVFRAFGHCGMGTYISIHFEGGVSDNPEYRANPNDFCSLFGEIYKALDKYLYRNFLTFFRRTLEPDYAYPESASAFWRQFNMSRFNQWHVAKRLV